MTDREILELAAKAAGIEWVPATTAEGKACELEFGLWLKIGAEPSEFLRRRWNPLADDGDALRLAVKLGIRISYSEFSGNAEAAWGRGWNTLYEYGPEDQCAATRRAIVRAAAEIVSAK